jgi:hypothetical protein
MLSGYFFAQFLGNEGHREPQVGSILCNESFLQVQIYVA